jgi:hypothetical protein
MCRAENIFTYGSLHDCQLDSNPEKSGKMHQDTFTPFLSSHANITVDCNIKDFILIFPLNHTFQYFGHSVAFSLFLNYDSDLSCIKVGIYLNKII